MADGAAGERLPSSNRGVSRSGSEELARAAVAETRTWAGLDWLAGSVDLWELLQEADWVPRGDAGPSSSWDGDQVDLLSLDSLAGYLRRFGPKRKAKQCDDQGVLVVGERAAFAPPDAWCRSMVEAAFEYLFAGTGLQLAKDAAPGSFYAFRWALHDVWGESVVGMLELGGELTQRKGGRPSLRFELTGQGCGIYEQRGDPDAGHAQRWLALRAKLARVDALLTRVDVAFDDFDGVRNLELARCMYDVGEFDYTFAGETKRPQFKAFTASQGGDTFYVGHSSSEKQLRVYQKGKQLGDQDSEWVRWELQLRSSSRKRVSLDVLEDPLPYMRGAFACLDFVSACVARLAVTKEVSKATAKSVLRHVRRQYGATLGQVVRFAPNADALLELINGLSVDKVPRWARNNGGLCWADLAGLVQCPTQPSEETQQ